MDTFRSLVISRFNGGLKGPFNEGDRQKAGMGKEFYEDLSGKKGDANIIIRYP